MAHENSLLKDILKEVSIQCSQPFVRDIESHYAGYWDELSVTVNLEITATQKEWEELATQLITYLNERLPKDNDNFSWVLSFWQDLRHVGLFCAGDRIEDNSAPNA